MRAPVHMFAVLLAIASGLSSVASAKDGLSVAERDGAFTVLRGGVPLITSITADRGAVAGDDVKSRYSKLADGTKVWNRWSESEDGKFRLEVAERADGAVEITLLGQVYAEDRIRRRTLRLGFPAKALSGKRFSYIAGGRESGGLFHFQQGAFGEGFERLVARFLAVDGLVFDFNPLGPGDTSGMVDPDDGGNQLNRNGVCALWAVSAKDGGFEMSAGEEVRSSWGGFAGAKIVIREGSADDYHAIHFLRAYKYWYCAPYSHLLAFGAKEHGPKFCNGNVFYTLASRHGWIDDNRWSERRWDVCGHRQGVLYSATVGRSPETYRFSGLPDGYYALTYAGGNYTGAENRFTLRANGEKVLEDASIGARELRTVTRALHVSGGRLDLEFTGSWLVSMLALQPIMGDAEDFSMRRGFWLTDGFEPCPIFRNVDYAAPAALDVCDETQILPEPGKECAAMPHAPPAPVELPDENLPSLAWTKTAKMKLLLANSVTMAEFDRPGSLDRYIDREWAGKNVEAVMLSGMHSRHTYVGSEDRGIEAVRHIAATLHARGIKVIDHHDATLLWNICGGFRVLAQRLGQTIRTLDTGLPSWQFCPLNHDFREAYYAYLRKLAEAGVDGFQIDELEFWHNGCQCRHCRDAFRRDTGWEIPFNELDAAWNDPRSALRRRWQDWRTTVIVNWFVELRRRLKDVRADLVLSNYTTNDGFFMPLPKRNASSDQLKLKRTVNYFGTEMMTRSAMRNGRNLLPLALSRNILSGPYAAPIWTWYYNVDWQNNYFAWGLSVMAGQTPLLSDLVHPKGVPDFERFGAGPAAMVRNGAENVAEVALLFSAGSRDWNDDGHPFHHELFGTAQMLDAMHVPYAFMGDADLERGVPDRCKALFLGEAQCLSDRAVAAVKAFAAKGGMVRLSVRAGTRNEMGEPREDCPFPKDGNFMYTSGNPGAAFELEENWYGLKWTLKDDPEREAAFRKELARWTARADGWKIDAPEKVFTTVWREASGAHVVQLLNGTGVNMKFGDNVVPEAPDPAFPPIAQDIHIEAPEGMRAEAFSPDFEGARPLEATPLPGGGLRVSVPKDLLKVYTLVRIHRQSKRSEMP